MAALPIGAQIKCSAVTLKKLRGSIEPEQDIDADFEFGSDETVADIMTTKAGIAWNLKRHSIRMSAAFGQGRLGATLRESAIWGDQIGVIVCGERGENATTMKLLGSPFCAVDVNYPDRSWSRPLRTSPRVRWSGHLLMRIHSMVPPDVAAVMRDELRKFDPATETDVEPELASGLMLLTHSEWGAALDACPDDDLIKCGTLAEVWEHTRGNPLVTGYVIGSRIGSIYAMPAGSGKTTLAASNAMIFDVDDILARIEPEAQGLRRLGMETGDWSALTSLQQKEIAAWIRQAPPGFLLLVHGMGMVPSAERWRFIGQGKVSRKSLTAVLSERDPERASITEYNWRNSDFPIFESHGDRS